MGISLDKEIKPEEGSIPLLEGEAKSKISDSLFTVFRFTNWIGKISEFGGLLGGILLPIAAAMIVYEILMRFFFGSPSVWVIELSTYLIVGSTLFSIAYTLKEKGHVRVDFITQTLSPGSNQIFEIVTYSLSLIFCIYLTWEGIKLTLDTFIIREVTATVMKVPRFLLFVLVPIGAIMMVLQLIQIISGLFVSLNLKRENESRKSSIKGIIVSSILIFLIIIGILLIKKATAIAAVILFFSLLLSGMPVSLALALFGMVGFIFFFESLTILAQLPIVTYGTLDNNVIAAIPLFILTSSILVKGQIGPKIYDFANVWLRHLPGGLGIASIVFCGIFAAITGSSAATAATVSLVAYPEMIQRGYQKRFVLGLLAAGGTLGILIPPSGTMMIYGAITGESIAALFMAGVIPALILIGLFVLYIILRSNFGKNKLPRGGNRASFRERITTSKSAIGGLMIPVIIIGGIYSGIFTPTEAAGVSVIYSLIICAVFYKTLSFTIMKQILLNAAKTSAMIMFIIVGANIASQVITMMQLAQSALQGILSLQMPPWLILIAINIFLFILGMPLEGISMMVVTLPILHPLIIALGFSPLWFAVVMAINIELAFISPPEGLNIFILQGVGETTAKDISIAVIPFLFILIFLLVFISFFPITATWLPSL